MDETTKKSLTTRLRRIEGQVQGLQRMLENDRECEEVLTQIMAVRSSLDINALPAPLRPMALFSANWRLSSDWTQWQIAR